ncbi:glycoside hydrolase family 5, putative [Babesia ovata]|uniref:Glycoside hydrolase family 5, putative n=1 Tax=Babesia ovata TaxID=189622 RepID=A0A2H6KF09_9APIC|nr:glycoside hydrolase family 5, putative [Babesia ovata]GBE61592.1 glycoside hydrolase family 5, putative [Babesia ovata]
MASAHQLEQFFVEALRHRGSRGHAARRDQERQRSKRHHHGQQPVDDGVQQRVSFALGSATIAISEALRHVERERRKRNGGKVNIPVGDRCDGAMRIRLDEPPGEFAQERVRCIGREVDVKLLVLVALGVRQYGVNIGVSRADKVYGVHPRYGLPTVRYRHIEGHSEAAQFTHFQYR